MTCIKWRHHTIDIEADSKSVALCLSGLPASVSVNGGGYAALAGLVGLRAMLAAPIPPSVEYTLFCPSIMTPLAFREVSGHYKQSVVYK